MNCTVWLKFEPVRGLCLCRIHAKLKQLRSKLNALCPCIVKYRLFSNQELVTLRQNVQWPDFEFVRDFMIVLMPVSLNKTEGAVPRTRSNIGF